MIELALPFPGLLLGVLGPWLHPEVRGLGNHHTNTWFAIWVDRHSDLDPPNVYSISPETERDRFFAIPCLSMMQEPSCHVPDIGLAVNPPCNFTIRCGLTQ